MKFITLVVLLICGGSAFGQSITPPISPSTWSGRGTGLSVATTVYWAPFFGHAAGVTTSELLTAVPATFGATATNLRIVCAAAPTNTHTVTATLRVNAASSALVATITNTNTSATDLTHSVAIAPGDQLDLQIVTDASATPPGNCVYSIQITPA